MDERKYTSRVKTAKYFGVSRDTLLRWEEQGLIDCIRTKEGITGHKRYDISSFKGGNPLSTTGRPIQNHTTITRQERGVCYCRVSTRNQTDDLARQVKLMEEQYPTFKIIKDFGSGINFKRKGLLCLLQGAIEGDFQTIVVAHRDRLTRFGFELFQWIFDYYKVRLVVLEQDTGSKESELCKDLLSIIHVFSCRANGSRRYKPRQKENKEGDKEGDKEENSCSEGDDGGEGFL